jgi:hypothetical protein
VNTMQSLLKSKANRESVSLDQVPTGDDLEEALAQEEEAEAAAQAAPQVQVPEPGHQQQADRQQGWNARFVIDVNNNIATLPTPVSTNLPVTPFEMLNLLNRVYEATLVHILNGLNKSQIRSIVNVDGLQNLDLGFWAITPEMRQQLSAQQQPPVPPRGEVSEPLAEDFEEDYDESSPPQAVRRAKKRR